MDLDLTAVEEDLALVEGVDAGDALDEGRLAGAVVADEGHHLTGTDLEVDLVERLHGTEVFRHSPDVEDGPLLLAASATAMPPFVDSVRKWGRY